MELDLEKYRRTIKIDSQPPADLSVIDIDTAGAGRTIVFLHGYGGKAPQWRNQLAELAKDSRVIALEMRGHGHSTKPGAYTIAQLAGDVAAALEQLQVATPFVLVGHSFGGAIAAEFTATHPGNVSRLVVIATPGEFHLRTYYKFLLALPYALHGIIAPFVKNWVGAPPGVMKSLYYNTLRDWRGWDTFAKVTIPTLLIRGKNDRIYADQHFRKVAAAFPNAKALTLNGGHMVMVTRGDAVNKAIRRFIEPEKHPHAYSEQQGSGKPLLLLHGMGSSLRAWDGLLPALHEAGFATHTLDLLGHGDSARFNDAGDASIELYYRHFADWLEELELPHPLTVVAHSMGGYLALSYALRNPGVIDKLVLVDPFYKPAQLSPWLRATTRRAKLSSGIMRRAPRWLVHTSVRLNRNIAAGLSRPVTRQMAADYQRLDSRITHTPTSTDDLSQLLPQVSTPTLVIWGKRDQTLAPVSFSTLLDLLPNAIGLPIRGAGHTPHMTHVAQVSNAILNFLD